MIDEYFSICCSGEVYDTGDDYACKTCKKVCQLTPRTLGIEVKDHIRVKERIKGEGVA